MPPSAPLSVRCRIQLSPEFRQPQLKPAPDRGRTDAESVTRAAQAQSLQHHQLDDLAVP